MVNVELLEELRKSRILDLEPSSVLLLPRHRRVQGITPAALSASRHGFFIDSIINKLI
jgi:hypothetical protein